MFKKSFNKIGVKMTYIDPPGGGRYGFPKVLPDPPPEDILEWLTSNGYPQAEIDSFGAYFYVRYFSGEMQ
jgi:hypothetical protein